MHSLSVARMRECLRRRCVCAAPRRAFASHSLGGFWRPRASRSSLIHHYIHVLHCTVLYCTQCCVVCPPRLLLCRQLFSSRLDSTRRPLSRTIEISARFEAVARPPIPTLVFRIARSPLTPLVYVMIYSVDSPDTSGHSSSFSSHLISASSSSCSWNRMLKWRLRLLVGSSSRRPESLALRSPSVSPLICSASARHSVCSIVVGAHSTENVFVLRISASGTGFSRLHSSLLLC